MTNGAGWDLLYNGSMLRAAYEVYDGSAAFNGFALATLYFLFHAMLFMKTRKPMPGFIFSMLFLAMYYTNQFYSFLTFHVAVIWVAISILIFYIGAIFYTMIYKH